MKHLAMPGIQKEQKGNSELSLNFKFKSLQWRIPCIIPEVRVEEAVWKNPTPDYTASEVSSPEIDRKAEEPLREDFTTLNLYQCKDQL